MNPSIEPAPSSPIVVGIEAGLLTIAFNRPEKKNSITSAMYQTMVDALAGAEQDPAVRAVLFRGSPEIFSAGNDLEDFMKRPPAGLDSPVVQFLTRISTASKPVLAAVSGPAVGIGTTLLLHCDLVYAADTARFSLPFAALGLCPEAASSLLLPQIAGYQRAAEKLLTGDAFDAQEAFAMGFVNKVLPAGEVLAYAHAQARKLVALPPASLRVTKSLLKGGAGGEAKIAARIGEELTHFSQMLRAPEAREAMSAFFEKRKPDFSRFS
ncbi:enoyl-CoA hydratase [Burkholderia sp. L27(2015)]|uniref:enoyl-CoA hydratase n=1 Tax=Burkholderia sp. L27(2015) TaxID=1641858 RepID=UPI00131C8823|nr:enoyl-CoA hydratase [Burkholderia sp. L27(2015)]